MMEERKLMIGNIRKYNHRNIHKEKAANNAWLVRQSRQAEELHAKHDAFHFQKRLLMPSREQES